jgi:CDP-glycerol glycerophosphotransferase (TagB/SpsB family)
MVKKLLARGCTVVFRPHPYARRSPKLLAGTNAIIELLQQDAAATGRAHVFGPAAEQEMSVADCCNAADALISDVSSVVADFLYSEKPLAMVAVSEPAEAFSGHFPIAEAAYVVSGHKAKLTGFDAVLDTMLGPDPLLETRRKVKAYYLGDIPAEAYGQRFLDEASRLL